MGGGSKKSGRGGGGGGKNRQRYPGEAYQSGGSRGGNQGSVPADDLRRAGMRLMAQSTGATKGQHRDRYHEHNGPRGRGNGADGDKEHGGNNDDDASSVSMVAAPGEGPLPKRSFVKFRPRTMDAAEMDTLEGEEGEEQRRKADEARKVREMAAFALSAARKLKAHEAPALLLSTAPTPGGDGFGSDVASRQKDQSLKRFYSEFRKVVDSSDVLLEVLDARDPMGCRLLKMERSIESEWNQRKHIVIVLNKIDLVPPEVTARWVSFFRDEGKTVVGFTAGKDTTSGRGTTGSTLRNSCIAELFRVLRQLARGESGATRKSITVGVIGYPNVGKSSVINALKRRNVVGVGNTPGFTTGNTEVDLRSDIKIIDCPGVVMPGEDTGDVVLRNAVKVDQLANPFVAVQRLLSRCDPVALARVYSISETCGGSVDEFVRAVGLRRGRVRTGSEVNEDETARMILHDWNDGRIGYYTLPPAQDGLLGGAERFGGGGVGADGGHDDADNDRPGASATAGPAVVDALSKSIFVDGLPTFHLTDVMSLGERKRLRAEKTAAAAAAVASGRRRDPLPAQLALNSTRPPRLKKRRNSVADHGDRSDDDDDYGSEGSESFDDEEYEEGSDEDDDDPVM